MHWLNCYNFEDSCREDIMLVGMTLGMIVGILSISSIQEKKSKTIANISFRAAFLNA